jgi:hypothetical protein
MRPLLRSSCWRVPSGLVALALVLAALTSCARTIARPVPGRSVNVDELWQGRGDLGRLDLVRGPGGRRLAPDPSAVYTLEKVDEGGYSSGYDVRAPDGRRWSVKLGPEAQTEVVVSRILWALGYHQPATYYLPRWTLSGAIAGPQHPGRFRLEPSNWNVVGEWSWYDNPFVDTQPFRGLIVANLVLNNWDWKTSNNKIIEYREDGTTERLYMVRDLGASLGRTASPGWLRWTPFRQWKQGSRNDIEGFESQRLIRRVNGDRVEFDYSGLNESLVDTLTVADVVWACRLMSRISDRQWKAVFDAAEYPDDISRRYIAKIKSKISEGLALARSTAP